MRSLVLVALLGIVPAWAQPAAEATNQHLFAPLDWPTPNQYRAANGAPGPAYWQQEADYAIDVALDPATHTVSGTASITYTNHSPHALGYLWLQLDQNLFRPNSRGATIQGTSTRWRGAFEGGGYAIERVALTQGGAPVEGEYRIDDTRMQIVLAEPLDAEGGQITIAVDYGFVIPEYGADRMGRLAVEGGTVYELAQWYPRMYVFDDVSGWNPMPYLGQGEFYLEFGTYEVALTVPHDFIVVATGELQNPDEVLTPEQQLRLERARQSADTVPIIARSEVGDPATRPASEGMLTWRFRAERVRDFAWAASPAFIWDAAGYQDVLVQSAYPAEGLGDGATTGWEMATQFGRHAIAFYSEEWFPYPYPVAISVAGIVGGMEYPMIQFSSVRARDQGLMGVIDHELGHNWFPMIVASDERRHAWMDEGFNTFINHYSNLDYWGEGSRRAGRLGSAYQAERMQSALADQPIATYPDVIRRPGLGFLAYRKPGAGLRLLREVVLGEERFDAAFQAYIQRWAFKHPQPADFFRTMEDVSGETLAWFWRGWFYGTGLLDQSIDGVDVEDGRTVVTLRNREEQVMPADVEVTYTDGRTRHVRVPVEAWAVGDAFRLDLGPGRVERLRLDPDGLLPDVDPSNNAWDASENPATPSSTGR